MRKSVKQPARSSRLSYQDLLDRETMPVPAALRASTDTFLGSEPLSVNRYLSAEYHELEKLQLWPRVWQSLCRDPEIAAAGDFYVQDITGTSVTGRTYRIRRHSRLSERLSAPWQAVERLALPLVWATVRILPAHCMAFDWNLTGGFQGAPCEWHFQPIHKRRVWPPGLCDVDTWRGWVFVNIDVQSATAARISGCPGRAFRALGPRDDV